MLPAILLLAEAGPRAAARGCVREVVTILTFLLSVYF